MSIRRVLATVALVAAIGTLPAIDAGANGDVASFCYGTYDAAVLMEDECAAPVGGSPFGVIAIYEVSDPTLPAEVHVEIRYTVPGTGVVKRFAQCEVGSGGTVKGRAECVDESDDPVVALPGDLPEGTTVACVVHSGHGDDHGGGHALADGVTALVRFGCYSGNAGEAALRDRMDDDGSIPDAPPSSPPPTLPVPDVAPGAESVVTSLVADSYTPPVAVMVEGGSLTYANLDAGTPHDVVASDRTPATADRPWCAAIPNYNVSCPIFWSKLVVGGPDGVTPVLGVDALAPGSYEFYCTIHSSMLGTLEVVA